MLIYTWYIFIYISTHELYKNGIDFFVLILYFVNSRNYFVDCLGFSV